MLDGCEILIGDAAMSRRGKRMLEAMIAAAPAAVPTERYTGRYRTLMMYGAGLESRIVALRAHRAAGGRTVIWDLGYWDREDAMRLAIDTLHPTAAQLAMAPAQGCRHPVTLREDADPDGPILLVGLGRKSAALYGLQPMEWERAKLAKLQKRYPGRAIHWRPKKGRGVDLLAGTKPRGGVPIEDALRGCSLVVCRHSNVGVDAAIAGIPVDTEDGAARSLYADGLPTPAQRAEFLRRLGWWNWRPLEAPLAWEWIAGALNK